MELIEYLPHFRVVVCKKCRIGVLMNSQFDTHFKRRHQVASMTRRAMKEMILRQHPQSIQNERLLEEQFQYPIRQAPLPRITTHEDGFACNMADKADQPCPYVCQSLTSIKDHCREEHGWINPQPSGGSINQRRAIQRPWRENVRCQRLFHHGPRNGYWEVGPEQETRTEAVQPVSSQAEIVEQKLAEIQEKAAELRARQDQVQPGVKLDANSWLERVGWTHHLQGIRWDTLIEWAALPKDEEVVLQRMCRSLDRVVDIAQEAIVEGHCPLFSRFDINRKAVQQNVRQPFQSRMEIDTKKR